MQRYVYGKIYNAKAYNLCSQMPRLGYSGTLTPEQIKDLVALLLDPALGQQVVAASRILHILGAAGVAGASLRPNLSAAQARAGLYDVKPFGNVTLLHITDTHAQLLPVYFREPFGLENYNLKSGTPSPTRTPTRISWRLRSATARWADSRISRRW